MKTTTMRMISTVILGILVSTLSIVSAQDFFFDKKWEDDKLISKVKYEMGFSGLYEKAYLYEYTYDDLGEFMMEDVYKWNHKKLDWTPYYRIVRNVDVVNNKISMEYITWNEKKKEYNEPKEVMIYQLNEEENEFSYLSIKKDKKITKIVDTDSKNTYFMGLISM